MDQGMFNSPLSLKAIEITDGFWKKEMELVREEVIPYQWAALNDRVEGATPSFCMRNFRIAGKLNRMRREQGKAFQEPVYTFRGFEALPEDPEHPEEQFYGFVFQDSDFYKWIEAVGYSLSRYPDPELECMADEAIALVCDAQREDGYLDTYYIVNGVDRAFSDLRDHHELYCFGHLIEGAVSYYQATGKDKLLNAARRFADHIAGRFGAEEGKCKGYPGHEVAEMALARLYEVTGEEKYLELGRFFIEERGRRPYYFDSEHPEEIRKGAEDDLRYFYNQAHLPVREQKEATGHAVRAVYLYAGMADMARLTGDATLQEACGRLWDNIVGRKMYITGGIGGTHLGEAFSFDYDLPNDTAYAETCASVGLIFLARRMLQLSPRSEYADVMERALYNGVLSGMALDGKSFFYVNPLEVNPEACHKDERKFHVKPMRQKWMGCACCPPNLARLLSSVGSYAYTENEDTLFIHLYMGSTVTKQVGAQTVDVCVKAGFPWDGRVRIHVRAEQSGFRLALRIPGWCEEYTVSGCADSERTEKEGYLYIRKAWGEEDVLELYFPMAVRVIAADPAVRETVGKVAVTRGPMVYCLEEADNGRNLHLLSVDPSGEAGVIDETVCGVPAKAVLLRGYREREGGRAKGLYHVWKDDVKDEVMLKFIPYYMWANRMENEMQVWVRVGR